MIDRKLLSALCAVASSALLAACAGPSFDAGDGTEPPGDGTGDGSGDGSLGEPPLPGPGDGTSGTPRDADGDGYIDVVDPSGTLDPEWAARLGERSLDYGAALRTASLRLRGVLPTLVEIRYVQAAADPRVAYESVIDDYLEDPLFTRRMIDFWRDTFRMGGGGLDTAPLFAAQLVVEDRDFNEVFTATSGTCPTFDGETSTFMPADCDNGVPTHAGVLTNPAVMRHFFSNLAFRRVRWVQEVFACAPFPAEIGMPTDVGGAAPYTAPWAWDSIAGADNGGRIDFHDVSSVTCANCHATMNHVAPLFASFDESGMWTGDVAVALPLDGSPLAVRTDWLPAGEGTAWRYGEPAPDLPALGLALAADEDVERCAVTRVWNWAMGHGDVVGNVDVVPEEVVAPYVDAYVASGHRLRAAVRAIFTSSDFVRF